MDKDVALAPRPADAAGALDPFLAEPRSSKTESELRALIAVSAAVAAAHALDDVLEVVAEETLRVVGAASVSICRWEREHGLGRALINVGDLGPSEERYPLDEVYPLADFPLDVALLERGEPYLSAFTDPDNDESEREMLARQRKSSYLAVPIVFEGRTWGQLEAYTGLYSRPLDLRVLSFLEAISAQVAAAIGRAELFSQLARQAHSDPLTGLANRRRLDDELERMVGRALTEGSDLALLFCDVDGLKLVNDTAGHAAGDRVLARVAQILTEVGSLGRERVVSRIGGDEFCVVLAGEGIDAARAFAAEASRRLAGYGARGATLSCGAASVGTGARRPADLFRAADAAQYAAKRAGGGRTYAADAAGLRQPEPATPEAAPARRSLRDLGRIDLEQLTAETLMLLDEGLAHASVIDRLQAVLAAFADRLDAAGWGIFFAEEGGSALVPVRFSGGRGQRAPGVPSLSFEPGGGGYPLADVPLTARILARGGNFIVHADGPEGDPAQHALLKAFGFTAVLGAAAAGPGGGHFVGLFADDATSALEPALPLLRLLVLEATLGAWRQRVTTES